jgi:hypothetical protein
MPALLRLWELAGKPGLERVAELFETNDERMEYAYLLLGSVVRSLRDMHALEFAPKNADRLNNPLNSVFRVCQASGANEVIPPLLLKLVDLHIEATRSGPTLVSDVPCEYDPLPPTISRQEYPMAFAFHNAKLLDCLNLSEAVHFDELALEMIDFIVEKIVKRFK